MHDGQFEVGQVVGEGSFSLTYAATQGAWRLPVAIKEFFPQGCRRARQDSEIELGAPWQAESFDQSVQAFLQEGAMLERFHHPGVVRVLAMFRSSNTAYLVEELLEGVTLGEGLSRAGTMPEGRVLELAHQAGQALIMVHAAGLVHSDLKPDNLFLTNQGRYVILDFGTARGYLSQTRVGQAAVSLGYSPPEQYVVRQKLTPAADVYALAATLYHLLLGQCPPEARLRQKGEPLSSMSALSPRVENALSQALHLDPDQRTSGIRAFLEQLGVDTSPRAANLSVAQFEALKEQAAHPGGVYVLALHAGSGRLFSAGRDGYWRCWSWPTLTLLHAEQAHATPVNALALSSDGAYLVSGAQDGSVKLWSTAGEVGVFHSLLEAGPAILCLSFHPHQGLVAASLGNGTCLLMGPSLAEPIRWSAHQGAANGVAVHPDGKVLATAGDDKAVHLWTLPDCNYQGSLLGHATRIQSLQYCRDGSALLTSSSDHSVRLWDVAANSEIRHLRSHRAMVWGAQVSCWPNLVITVSADRWVRAFRLDSGLLAVNSEAHEGWARALVVDPQHPLLATGGGDGKIRLWRIPEI